jgi:phosphoribosylanthranilate isomerase
MSHFQIKVCGITRPEDAQFAASLGADMIGMIIYKGSARYVTTTKARQVVSALPPTVDPVLVLVDATPDEILRIAERTKSLWVQLHSRYTSTDIKLLQRNGLKVIHAFRVSDPKSIKLLRASQADLVMIDNSHGTGQQIDIRIAPQKLIPNLVLAGGISVANVRQGVTAFQPAVVDINSSVESSPGIKSKTKLREFFIACNELRYER